MDVATEGGPSETGNGRGGPASRNCNKGGQDMDMSLLLLRLERLGHLKIAAGLQATTTRLVLSPFPPPHYFQPLLFFSFFLFSFCQRHCLAFDVLVCVCFAHVRIFYGSKKITPKWQTRWCACGNVNWGVYKLLSALAQHFFGPSCSFCCCCSRVCPFRTPNRQSSIYLAHTCVTVAAFLLLAMNT